MAKRSLEDLLLSARRRHALFLSQAEHHLSLMIRWLFLLLLRMKRPLIVVSRDPRKYQILARETFGEDFLERFQRAEISFLGGSIERIWDDIVFMASELSFAYPEPLSVIFDLLGYGKVDERKHEEICSKLASASLIACFYGPSVEGLEHLVESHDLSTILLPDSDLGGRIVSISGVSAWEGTYRIEENALIIYKLVKMPRGAESVLEEISSALSI